MERAPHDEEAALLLDAVQRMGVAVTRLDNVRALTSGASHRLWAFDGVAQDGRLQPLLLRSAPAASTQRHEEAAGLEAEAVAMAAARTRGVPVPRVHGVLMGVPGIGDAMLMERVEGETIPRRILRDSSFDRIRPQLAGRCGEILARLHQVPSQEVAGLRAQGGAFQVAHYWETYSRNAQPKPVFARAFRWLRDSLPAEVSESVLVHGDFRNGNLMIAPDGVRAVLDWELTHTGDPMEDLGWICVNSWRFGNLDLPVGGFGSREQLFEGYRSAGGRVDEDRVRFWEVLGTLKWGIWCQASAVDFLSGAEPTIERAAIARRSSETEVDLMRLLHSRGS